MASSVEIPPMTFGSLKLETINLVFDDRSEHNLNGGRVEIPPMTFGSLKLFVALPQVVDVDDCAVEIPPMTSGSLKRANSCDHVVVDVWPVEIPPMTFERVLQNSIYG